MTIEQLAEQTADKLKALSDEELDKVLRPYYTVTRPELIVRKEKKEEPQMYLTPAKKEALALLQESGVDISFMKRKFKR